MRPEKAYGQTGLFGQQMWIQKPIDFLPWYFVRRNVQDGHDLAALDPVIDGRARHLENLCHFRRPEPRTNGFVHSVPFR